MGYVPLPFDATEEDFLREIARVKRLTMIVVASPLVAGLVVLVLWLGEKV